MSPENERTKICKECERELPLTQFSRTKGENYLSTCKACQGAAISAGRKSAMAAKFGGGTHPPINDSDFGDKEPREVLLMMGRAKRWLESRGYIIRLDGEFHETKIRKVKFE